MLRVATYLACASAVTILFSIAASQILLGLALAALLLSGAKLRLPPVWPAMAAWLALTVVALAASPDPGHGLPQIRKFFVYATVLVCFSLLRDLTLIRRLVLCLAGAESIDALRGLMQFYNKAQDAASLGRPFYDHYVANRITGFTNHWMTFGGKLMVVLLLLGAFYLFAPAVKKRWVWILCLGALGSALVLNWTRNIWGAAAVGAVYLLWNWRRWSVAAVPVILGAGFLVAPESLRTRAMSSFQPNERIDSNQHRLICRRIGYQMIRAHPWFGIGPKQVELQYRNYIPADVPKPLPGGFYGHLHNIYVHFAAELGIPAVLALLWMLLQPLVDFTRALTRLPPGPGDRRFLLHGAIAVILGTMVSGFWEVNLGDSEPLTLFLVVISCGYVAAAPEEPASV